MVQQAQMLPNVIAMLKLFFFSLQDFVLLQNVFKLGFMFTSLTLP